jgi:hypothetical protein
VRLVADVTDGNRDITRIVLLESASGVFLSFYGPREASSCVGEEWYESRQGALDACRRRFLLPEEAWRPTD